MSLDFDKVHIFERHGGSEVLTRTNLYKMFERAEDLGRSMDGRRLRGSNETYIVQGGTWFDRGGNTIALADIPAWVWDECKAMNPIDRGMYRILLPDEIAAGATMPTFEEEAEFPPSSSILRALVSLDSKDDKLWTTQGLPHLESLSKLLGARVSRRRLESVAPRFVRPV